MLAVESCSYVASCEVFDVMVSVGLALERSSLHRFLLVMKFGGRSLVA